MSNVHVNGVSLYYEELGDGAAILCIHGAGSSALMWGDAVGELARYGRVVVYDRRGCTRSERPEPYTTTSVREQADDAIALLRALEDATPAVLIGRSYGGEIAIDIALRHPELVRALVLLEPAIPGLSSETTRWMNELTADVVAAATTSGPGTAVDRFFGTALGEDAWAALPESARMMFVDNADALLAELTGEWSAPDADELARVTVPVLVVSGEASPEPYRRLDVDLAGMLPTARHEVVTGGHLINPASGVVQDFLSSVLRPV